MSGVLADLAIGRFPKVGAIDVAHCRQVRYSWQDFLFWFGTVFLAVYKCL